MDLNITWFILYAILIIGYAILDGFDLGVGIIHIFTRGDKEKRMHMNAIGPVWDGNEVWLVTAGGALFAAFPQVYATVFSGFYLAMFLLLCTLMARAVSMEFRSKVESVSWRKAWDMSFGLGSLLTTLLFGVAVGNIVLGIPITEEGIFEGSFLGLLNPLALVAGILTIFMFTMQGAIYMTLKTIYPLRKRYENIALKSWMIYLALVIIISILAPVFRGEYFKNLMQNPAFWIFAPIFIISSILIPLFIRKGKNQLSFLASSVSMGSYISLLAVNLFPNLVPSSLNPDWSLTIYNSSSSQVTLKTMLIIALLGMPLVLAYTIIIYRIFKGKVIVAEDGY